VRPLAFAVALSLALHVGVLGLLHLVRGPDVHLQYEIDVIDAPPAPPEGSTAPPPRRPPKARRSVVTEQGALVQRRPKRPDPPSEVDAGAPPDVEDLPTLAPASARLVVLLRTDRLRDTPMIDAARAALLLLPDGQLAQASGLDPLIDFDALLVATANPLDVTQTFLAARTTDQAKVRERFRAPGGGDPRVLAYPSRDVAVLARPEHMAAVTGAWLTQLDRFADVNTTDSLLEVTVSGLHGVLVLGGIRVTLPLKGQARLTWPAAVHARVEYETVEDAAQLAAQWPQLSDKVESAPLVRLLGLGGITEKAKVEAAGKRVTLDSPLEARQLEAVGRIMRLVMDQMEKKPNTLPVPIPIPRLERAP
jgi:hypothetical protein